MTQRPDRARRLIVPALAVVSILSASGATARGQASDAAPAEQPSDALPSEQAPAAPPSERAPAAPPPARVTASFTEGVRVSVPEAAGFVFEAHLATWARFVFQEHSGNGLNDYFEVPLVRPVLQASVLDGMIRLFVQPELAGPSPRLLDLILDFVPDPALQLRVGQFRTPYSRAFVTPIVQLSMADRGVVSDTFRADRDTGLMVSGQVAGAFEYSAGIFNGSGIDGRLGDTPAPMGVARVVVTPYGAVPYDQAPSLGPGEPSGLAIGLGGLFRERDAAAEGEAPAIQQTAGAGADLSFVHGPVTLWSEGFFREQRLDDGPWVGSWGAFAQAGVFVVPRVLELSARAGWIDPNIEAGEDLVQSYEGAIKGYFFLDDVAYGHHLSLAIHYRFLDTARPFAGFATGRTHRVIAQLQLWI